MQIRKIKTSATRPDQAIEVRYYGFVNKLEMLSNRYGVALQVARGVQFFDPTIRRVAFHGFTHSAF